MTVTFSHSEPLVAGAEGDYTLDVYRRTPEGSGIDSAALGSYPASAKRRPDGRFEVEDTTAGVPAETEYMVEVIDPLGRRSARVVVATVP